MVVVIVARGMRLVIVIVITVVRCCLGMPSVVVIVPASSAWSPGLPPLSCSSSNAISSTPFGRHHPGTAEVRRVDQTVEPAFELQPVDHEDPRFADGPRVGRGRLVDMRIPVGADERRDGDVLSTDALHPYRENREGSHHRIGLSDCAKAGAASDTARTAVADIRSALRVGMETPFRLRDGGAGRPVWQDRPPARRPATARRRDPRRG